MGKVTVYMWSSYDAQNDTMRLSRRWATREAAEQIGKGIVDESSAVEIETSMVGREVTGMTEIDFDPQPR